MKRKVKLLLTGTSGGHLTELLTLFEGLEGIDMIVFSEKTRRQSAIQYRFYSYARPHGELLTMILSGMKALYIILRERPDWIVTTGAECGAAALIAGKLLFRKTMLWEKIRHRLLYMNILLLDVFIVPIFICRCCRS